MLQTICDIIILIGAVIVAITNISKFIGKPITFFQKKSEEEYKKKFRATLRQELPKVIQEEEISNQILSRIMPALDEIKELNAKQDKKIETLAKGSRDILREKIMGIYHKNKINKTLSIYEKEALDQYYKDYKQEDGNSYIDKYYNRMTLWETIWDTTEE